MSEPLRFCFALHLHQPVGNFGSVFDQHLADVYRPLLETLERGELWPVALHVSGPLLEWIDAHAPDFLDTVARAAQAGKLELLCAGHDEPILAVQSRQDRYDQVRRHREWLRRRLGVDARGLWLTERVWEPTLPGDLEPAGVEFVLVDDRHFRVTGFQRDQLHRHFVTEAGGHRLGVFPIDEQLRYLIPFRPASELADYLRTLHRDGHALAVLGDDGEKFGGWPGTRKWLYDDGWLTSFIDTIRSLRDSGEVILSRFDEARKATPSGGLAYLPSASYREMEAWSLPTLPSRILVEIEEEWGPDRLAGPAGGLLRGGHWRHFLVKYPESNRMHKLAMALSALARERGDPPEARAAIGRAQCNDAYWHGVFGGLYLPFLRQAIWSNLARAERILRDGEPVACESRDLDATGDDKFWIHSSATSCWIAPRRGGVVELWQDLNGERNLLNVIARHREAYHEPGGDPGVDHATADTAAGAASIHDLETTLTELPPADEEGRGLFVDHVITAATTVQDYIEGRVAALWSWDQTANTASPILHDGVATIALAHDGWKKEIAVDGAHLVITCTWSWRAENFPAGARFATELSFSEALVIEALDATPWEYPIETVAKSEKGFDRTVQGRAVVLTWPISAGRAAVTVRAAA